MPYVHPGCVSGAPPIPINTPRPLRSADPQYHRVRLYTLGHHRLCVFIRLRFLAFDIL